MTPAPDEPQRTSVRPPPVVSAGVIVLAAWALTRVALVVTHALTPHGRVPLAFLALQGSTEQVQRYADLAHAWLTHAPLPAPRAWLPFALLPRLLAGDFAQFRVWFALQMVLIDLATLLLVRRCGARFGDPRGTRAAAVYVVLTSLLGPWIVQRHDAAIGFGVLSLVMTTRGRAMQAVRGAVAVGLLHTLARGPGHAQTLLWIAGGAAALAASPHAPRAFGGALLAAFGLTAVAEQLLSVELARGDALATAVRIMRDGALLVAAAGAAAPRKLDAVMAALDAPIAGFAARLRPATVALGLVFAWTLVASLSPVGENDLWWLMRVGKDVLATGHIPTTDAYSATAFGRPFHAHEWLAGVAFYRLAAAAAGWAPSALQALLACGCAALLVLSLPRERRQSIAFLPALVCTLYVVAFRIDLRPHVLSLLGLCYFGYALERWRRDGNPRPLLALVPLQVVWVNVHGEAWLVPVLLAALAVGAALEAARWTRAADPRPLGTRDAALLLALAVATGAASLVNPYGARAAVFAFHMGSGQRFMMRDVAEWQPTLSLFATHDYPFWAAMALLAVLWGGLLLRGRAVCGADAALAIVATVLGLRCVRFTGELAVLTFPLLVRTVDAVIAARSPKRAVLRRPWLEAAVVALLLAGTARYGYAFTAVHHRTFGVGFGGDLPYAHVNLMRRLGLRGVVFNDYESGGLIEFELHPHVRPVMDSRVEVFGPATYAEYSMALDDPAAFDAYLDRHGVDLVLLALTPRSLPALQHLAQSSRWQVVSNERGYALMKRAAPPHVGQEAALGAR